MEPESSLPHSQVPVPILSQLDPVHTPTSKFLKIYLNRRIFGPKRDEVTGNWKRLHNEELNDLYSSPNIVRVIKSRRMRWPGHVQEECR